MKERSGKKLREGHRRSYSPSRCAKSLTEKNEKSPTPQTGTPGSLKRSRGTCTGRNRAQKDHGDSPARLRTAYEIPHPSASSGDRGSSPHLKGEPERREVPAGGGVSILLTSDPVPSSKEF